MSWLRTVFAAVAVLGVLAVCSAEPAWAAPNAADQTFLQKAHQSNLAEIQAGRLAQQKGVSAAVRSMGARLVADHTALDAALRPVAGRLGVALPQEPNVEQRQAAARLATTSGAAFDRAWVAALITGHEQAVADGQEELRAGSDQQVRKLASSAAPVIAGHLSMLRQIAGGAPSGVDAGSGGQRADRSEPATAVGASLLVAGVILAALAGARGARGGRGVRGLSSLLDARRRTR